MTKSKFISDTKTVLKFVQLYCDKKHIDEKRLNSSVDLKYLNESLHIKLDYNLCSTCKDTFLYSYARLQECPHEEKPRCRKCPNPCYEKNEWKKLAKIMKYSGMRLGLSKIKKFFNDKT